MLKMPRRPERLVGSLTSQNFENGLWYLVTNIEISRDDKAKVITDLTADFIDEKCDIPIIDVGQCDDDSWNDPEPVFLRAFLNNNSNNNNELPCYVVGTRKSVTMTYLIRLRFPKGHPHEGNEDAW